MNSISFPDPQLIDKLTCILLHTNTHKLNLTEVITHKPVHTTLILHPFQPLYSISMKKVLLTQMISTYLLLKLLLLCISHSQAQQHNIHSAFFQICVIMINIPIHRMCYTSLSLYLNLHLPVHLQTHSTSFINLCTHHQHPQQQHTGQRSAETGCAPHYTLALKDLAEH